ncbi:MAG: hypothetical protein WC755_02090 [Candidatus Woesearchaeota archaeon]|jgi:hypothetical protein
MIKKVNAMYTNISPLSSTFKKIIYPQIKESMPFVSRKVEKISDLERLSILENEHNCSEISYDETIFSLDYKHWYLDDRSYDKYCTRIAELNPEYLLLSENSMYIEKPFNISDKMFFEKMSERIGKLYYIIKNQCESVFVSPILSCYNFSQCIEFIERNINYFDIVSVIPNNLFNDDIDNIYRLNKPLWVFYSDPCPVKLTIDDVFRIFNEREKMNFFYFGIDQESKTNEEYSYKPWDRANPFEIVPSTEWDWTHKMGLSCGNKIKTGLLKSLIDLADKYNLS